ncbi:MAG TPA: DKNYY domain-containing protein [Chitinophagaceae bacterium]
MKLVFISVILLVFGSCLSPSKKNRGVVSLLYAKEPIDSADYKHLKNDFYIGKDSDLYERKLALARDSNCNCQFEVFYDKFIFVHKNDSIIKTPLGSIIDINSFTIIDSTEFAKDKNRVYYFHGNSDGGNRVIVVGADPASFKRLCEYRWGIDKDFVYYENARLNSINTEKLQVLNSPDTADHFVSYLRDDKNVFFESTIIPGADAATFKVVTGQSWDAEDRNNKYYQGRRY